MKKNNQVNILIVDDDFTIREVLKKLLVRTLSNVSILSSDNGIKGLGLVELHNPDLLIVDSTLPEFAGAELVHAIKKKEGFTAGRKVVLIHEDDNFPKINDPSITMFSKSDRNFVEKFTSYLSFTYSIDSQKTYRQDLQNKLIKKLIRVSNRCDVIMHKISKRRNIFNPLRWIVWLLNQIYLSILLTFFYLLSGGKVRESNPDSNRDLTLYRVRYYPTLTTLLIGLILLIFQLGVFVASGFAVLHYNISQLVAQTSCALPSSPSIINTQVVISPDNVDGIIDCASLDIIVGPTGEIVIERYVTENSSTDGDWGVTLLVNNLTVQNGGKITADGKGYTVVETESVGKGGDSAGQTGGAGGGHGGAGGQGVEDSSNPSGFGGSVYGSNERPSTLGGAGGNGGGSSSSYQQDWLTNEGFNNNGTSFSSGLHTASTPGLELTSTKIPGEVGDQLITHYPIDEESGQSLLNEVESGSEGIFGFDSNVSSDDPSRTFSDCKYNGCLSFDGSNDVINIDNNFGQSNTLSISLWFKTGSTGPLMGQGNLIAGSANVETFVPTLWIMPDGKLRSELFIGTSNGILSSGAVNDNQWHHLVLTSNVNTQSLYLDNTLVGTLSGSIAQSWWTKTYLGASYVDTGRGAPSTNWYYYNGIMDEVRIYNKELNTTEITDLFENIDVYSSGEQTWTSETIDAGALEAIHFNVLTADWNLDGTDNIAPKFQLLASETGSFDGEEVVFPATGEYYQNGGTYGISDNVQRALSEVSQGYKYWKVKSIIDSGSDLSDTPKINGITLSGTTLQTGDAQGGAGGGSIKISATGSVTVNGKISANGLDGAALGPSSGGGGAGGSIWIEANTLSGSGIIEARGGSAAEVQYQGGGGGGGRLVVLCTTANNFSGTASVAPGITANSQDGGVGTIIGPTCRPNAPEILKQFKSNQITEIPLDGITTESTIIFAGSLVDVDTAETLSLQIELKELGQDFTGVPNYTQASNFANPQACTTPVSNCGRITVSGLTRSKEYHWQARVRDNKGGYSYWVSFGTNLESERDVLITGNPAVIQYISGNTQSGIVNSTVAEELKVRVLDASGYPVPGYTVNWSVVNGASGGQYNGGNAVTDNDGYSSRNYKLGLRTGENVARAAGSGLTGSPIDFTFTGNPDSVSKFVVTGPQYGITGESFGPVEITVYDQYDNIKTDYTGTPGVSAVKSDNSAATGILTPTTVTFAPSDAGMISLSSFSHDTVESIKIKVMDGSAIGYSNIIAIVDSLGSCPDVDGIVDSNQTWTADLTNMGIFDCRNVPVVQITASSTLTLVSYNNGNTNWTDDFGTTILANDIQIDASSKISASGKGYGQNRGGGSYGVYGGYANNGTGTPYGSVYEPKDLGSSSGGGAIKLVVEGTLTNNGSIETNGNTNTSGTGGSVWIDTDAIAGDGSIVANAGTNSDYRSINGSGGRIAIYYNSDTSTIINSLGTTSPKVLAQSTGCTCSWTPYPSGPGTIYVEDKVNDTPRQGSLFVRNVTSNNATHRAAIVQSNEVGLEEFVFKKIVLTNYGHLDVVGQTSQINLTSPDGLTGDATTPKLSAYGTFKYSGTDTLAISGADLTIRGKMELINGDSVEVGGDIAGKLSLYANTWYYNNTNEHVFGNIHVLGNGTINLVSYNSGDSVWTNDYGLVLNANNINIETGGIVSGTGTGYGQNRGGGSYGVYGGYAYNNTGTPYGSVYEPVDLGSSSGGGAIKLKVGDTLTNNGTIESNGNYNTAGSGGSVWIDTNVLYGSGVITANAGGNSDYRSINGSGGRVAVYYNTDNSDILNTLGTGSPKVQAQSTGCSCSWTPQPSGPGTIYVEDKQNDIPKQGILYVRNVYSTSTNHRAAIVQANEVGIAEFVFKEVNLTNYGHLDVVGQTSIINLTQGDRLTGDSTAPKLATYGIFKYTGLDALVISGTDVTIKGKMELINGDSLTMGGDLPGKLTLYANTWYYNNTNEHVFGDINVTANGTINLVSYNSGDSVWTNDYGLVLNARNINVDQGGVITASGFGYSQNRGGGSYGVYGGYAYNNTGTPYGSVYEPVDLGSSSGGGAIKLVISETLTNNGSIQSNGTYNTVGSGGSIWIDTDVITGTTGTITANAGSNSDYRSINGSGGRVAIYYNTAEGELISSLRTASSKIQAQSTGCSCDWTPQPSGPGTIYIEDKLNDTPKEGTLFVRNVYSNNTNHRAAIVQSQEVGIDEFIFKEVNLTNYGHLDVVEQSSILTLTQGDKLTGDTTAPKLVTSGTFKYTGENTLVISGTDVTIKGKMDLVNLDDIELGGDLPGKLTLYANTWYYNNENSFALGDAHVTTNGTLNLVSYNSGDSDWTNDYGLDITFENLNIEEGGIVSASGTGYSQNRGGGSQGVYGGYASDGSGAPYGSVFEPVDLGSSSGGGAIKLTVNDTLTNNGSIQSNGNANTVGSGGSIWINANTITGTTGTITANAGSNSDYRSLNGSGGRVAIYYNTDTSDILNTLGTASPQVQAQSTGCDCEWTPYPSGGGTIYVEDKQNDESKKGSLFVRNVSTQNKAKTAAIVQSNENNIDSFNFKKVILTSYGNLTVVGDDSIFLLEDNNTLSGDSTLSSLIIKGTLQYTGTDPLNISGLDITNKGKLDLSNNNLVVGSDDLAGGLTLYANTWFYNQANQYVFGNLEVYGNGVVKLVSYNSGDNIWTNDYGVNLTADNLIISSGGIVTSTGYGYSQNRGGGSQGVYGGFASDESGTPYGDLYKPVDLGSSSGGGAMKLVINDTLMNDGSIQSNGNPETAGSGGSIWIDTSILDGDGSITANAGSNSDYRAINGSGGRVAVYYNTDNSGMISTMGSASQKIEARTNGCRCSWVPYPSGPGTVYIEHKGAVDEEKGDLYIHNNGADGRAMDFDAKDYYFNNVYIGDKIKVVFKQDLFALRSNETVDEGGNVENMGDAIAIWNFEEQSDDSCNNGADYCDTSGNSRNLTSFGGTRSSEGKVGNALQLDGNSYAEVDLSGLNVSSFTIGMWAKLGEFTANGSDAEELINFNDIATTSSLDIDYTRNFRFEWPSKLVTNIVSQGKTATMSTVHSSGSYPPSNCFDGNPTTFCHSNGQAVNDWVQVDLGQVQNIDKVAIWNRSDCCAERITAFKIEVSNTGSFTGEQTEVVNVSGQNVGYPSEYTFDSVNTRYVRLTKLNNDYLNLGEVQVFADATYLPDNQWQHVVATYDAATGYRRIYVNGQEVISQNQGTNYSLDLNKISIGKGGLGSSTGFVGLIDEVFLYPRALTAGEIGVYENTYSWNEYNNKRGRGPVLNLSGSFTTGIDSLLTAKGLGFPSEAGVGRGARGAGQSGGAGGGHGGTGGTGESDGGNPVPQGGTFYGNQRTPLTIGSGGGKAGTGAAGGAGGGAIAVRARTGNVLIKGTIDVSGENGKTASPGGGGGAGGSILVEGQTCSITGTLNAMGGNGGDDAFDGGGGGGGRISILYTQGPCEATGNVTIANGSSVGGQSGQVGTYPTISSIPATPTFKDQYKSDGETNIPVGGQTTEQTVNLKASVSDPGASILEPQELVAEFEVVGINESFTAASTFKGKVVPDDSQTIFAGVFNSATSEYTGGVPLVAEVNVSGLEPGGEYKWRARVVNEETSVAGSWTDFGNNSSNQADFIVANTVALEIIPDKTTVIVGEPITLTVNAKDGSNNNDSTYRGTVHFTSNPSANSSLPSDYIFGSSDNGSHVFNNQLTFLQAGTYTVTVTDTVAGSLTATTSQITVNLPPAQMNSLQIAPDKTSVVQGEPISLTVSAIDQYSQIYPNYIGNVTFGSTAGGSAILPNNYTFVGGDNGVHNFANSVIFNQVGVYTITVSDTSNSSLTATTTQITVNPSIDSLNIIPSLTTVYAGDPITLTVNAFNSNNQPDTYYRGTVTFTTTGNEDTILPENYSFIATDGGTKDFVNDLIFTQEGIYTVTVTDVNNNALTAETVEITVNPALPQSDATSLELTSNKVEALTGEPLSLTVVAKDEDGNVVEDYYSTVRFSSTASPDVDLPNNYKFNILDLGEHEFTDELIFYKAGEYTVTVRDILVSTLTDTLTFNVTSSTQRLSIIPSKTSIKIGESIDLKVDALNSNNQNDVNYKGTVAFTSTSNSATLPIEYTFSSQDAGSRNFANGAKFVESGIYTITVQDQINNQLRAVSENIIVNPNNICLENPDDISCLVDVEITNVTIESLSSTSKRICWKTNISTVGNIEYGLASENIYSSSSDIEEEYAENHCQVLENLEENSQYIFKIRATSNAGKFDEHEDGFSTNDEDFIPVGDAKQCIITNNYAFNSNSQAVLTFSTEQESFCKVFYGNNPNTLEHTFSDNQKVKNHTALLDLAKLNGKDDLYYKIDCVNLEKTCINNGIIPVSKYSEYYPQKPFQVELSENTVPAILTLTTIATGALNVLTYPGMIIYAFPWFGNRKRKSTWGLVYDEKSREPIPFVMVRLYDEVGKIQKQIVTGFDGKYGFLVNKGSYVLEVKHSDYHFEKFEVTINEDEGIAAKNIGLAKKSVKKNTFRDRLRKFREKIKKSLPQINNSIVIIGFIISVVAIISNPIFFNYFIFSIYLIQLLVLILFNARKREWGYVYDSTTYNRIKSASVRVFDIKQGRQVDIQLTDEEGRFGFKLAEGEYNLQVNAAGYELDVEKLNKKYSKFESATGQVLIKVEVKKDKQINVEFPMRKTKEVLGKFEM